MLIDDSKNQTRSYGENGRELPLAGVQPAATTNDDERTQSEETALFDLYEKIAETRPGTRDAEIFAKIREWTFSDFSTEPHAFAGISETELFAWQKRHRINLSGGHIRPADIDIQRGHAWGTIRRNNHVNGLHIYIGPPSAEELALELTGY